MGHYKGKCELDFINKYIKSSMNILDIGGGSGRFAIPLYEKGYKITVIDKNSEAISILLKRNSEIVCINDDFLKIEFDEDKKYDMIISIEVLLYIKLENWPLFLSKVYNLLVDGGVFIFTATNKNSWRTVFRKVIKYFKKNSSDYNYVVLSVSEYLRIIKDSSFKIDCINGFLWVPCKLGSNSIFVKFFSLIERYLFLKYFISQSPWLLFALKKFEI